MSSDQSSDPQPDSDTIKMFVGQIPRNWGEAECRTLFEEYGPVFHLNILKNRETQQSQGCCFVTYFHRKDAMAAQNALHNLKVLPGMIHPVQMKPADGENRNERKLFVGMLNRNMHEDYVKNLFSPFGQIEECTVLRDDEGRSRGCAFVTFVTRQCALKAIKQMHHSQTFEGCSKPIVVKFADSSKDKKAGGPMSQSPDQNIALQQLLNQNRSNVLAPSVSPQLITNQLAGLGALLQIPGIIGLLGSVITGIAGNSLINEVTNPAAKAGPSGSSGSASVNLSNVPLSTSSSAIPPSSSNTGGGSGQGPLQSLQQQQLQALQAQQMIELLKQQQQGSPDPTSPSGMPQQLPGAMQTSQANMFQLPNSAEFLQNNLSGLSALNQLKTLGTGYPGAAANPMTALTSGGGYLQGSMPAAAASAKSNDIPKGPDGCNLFIYHLPQDFGDLDLYGLFKHFGNVISAKVFIDKQTNLSKCFGFVSFDNPVSARNAINGMNGFAIGSKRLKVQLKGKKDTKPYDQPSDSSASGGVQTGY